MKQKFETKLTNTANRLGINPAVVMVIVMLASGFLGYLFGRFLAIVVPLIGG